MTPGTTTAARASSSGYKTIYSFGQLAKYEDGRTPLAGLTPLGGELYGTTQFGGATNAHCPVGCGTVFQVDTSGSERVLHRFAGGSAGAWPLGRLTAVNGTLYGTTSGGGSGTCAGGCGLVFEIEPDGTESVIYTFHGKTDGANPVAGLLDLGGSLYGTTEFGGTAGGLCSHGCGTVFKLSVEGSESVLHRFAGGKDGARPVAPLVRYGGRLYGTTQYGGATTDFCASGCGTVFTVSTAGAEKTLGRLVYAKTSRGPAYPTDSLTPLNGLLYGTTVGGGTLGDGTVFSIAPASGAIGVVHSFICCSTSKDGAYPFAPLVRVGSALYGSTRYGGSANEGTLFAVTPSGGESVIHNFLGNPDGAQPEGALRDVGGVLYGTASEGGSRSEGSIFRLPP